MAFLSSVGRFCYYEPDGIDQADNVDSFPAYKETLQLHCEEGEPGVFTWTPDENTPSEVYYQVRDTGSLFYNFGILSFFLRAQNLSME